MPCRDGQGLNGGCWDSLHWMDESLEVKGAAMLASPNFTIGVLSSSRSRSTWLRRSCGGRWQGISPGQSGCQHLPPETHPLGSWLFLRGRKPRPLLGSPGGGPNTTVVQNWAVPGSPSPFNDPLRGIGQECYT